MAKRKYIHHGSLRDKKADLGSNATACATINHSLNDGQTVELSISVATTLNITDVWDGARAVLAVTSTSACGTLTLQVNGTAVDPVQMRGTVCVSCVATAISASSFTANDINIIYLDVIDDAADVHSVLYTTI
jgi:hypothetical protein